MKRVFVLLLALSLFLLPACSGNSSPTVPDNTTSGEQESSTENDNNAIKNASGTLEISFDFTRGTTIASNQYAVWIEDESGKLVKTLFVTDFTALGGYEKRKESLPTWVSKANPADMNESVVDAISGATPKAGKVSYTWDGTDANGEIVPNGTYTVCLEGTMYWTSSVLFRGQFNLGGETQFDIPFISTYTEDEATNRDMLSNITANYTATKSEIDGDETNTESSKTNALGGLSPSDALEYIKNTPDIVIVQVNTAEWKITPGFIGVLWIPHDEIAERYDEIQSGVPVILHCGAGVVSVPAYETLLEKRPDIPELSYIAGSPHSIIDEYNDLVSLG